MNVVSTVGGMMENAGFAHVHISYAYSGPTMWNPHRPDIYVCETAFKVNPQPNSGTGDVLDPALSPVANLLTCIKFNPSMDKRLRPLQSMGQKYLSIPKLQQYHRRSLGIDTYFIAHFIMDVITFPCRD